MKNHNNLALKVDRSLNSIDGIQRADSNPFLYTKIKARLEDHQNWWARTVNFISRPAIAFSATAIFLIVNILVVLQHDTVKQVSATAFSESDISYEAEYATVGYSMMDVNSNER